MRKAAEEEITQAMTVGITFKGAKLKAKPTEEKIKTKAKKKADIRKRRANRHKNKG